MRCDRNTSANQAEQGKQSDPNMPKTDDEMPQKDDTNADPTSPDAKNSFSGAKNAFEKDDKNAHPTSSGAKNSFSGAKKSFPGACVLSGANAIRLKTRSLQRVTRQNMKEKLPGNRHGHGNSREDKRNLAGVVVYSFVLPTWAAEMGSSSVLVSCMYVCMYVCVYV